MFTKLSRTSSFSLIHTLRNSFANKPPRLPFSNLAPEDISHFKSFLQPHEIITDAAELDIYNQDWKKTLKGHSSLLLKPNSTEKISKILKHCNDRKLAVVPQGGNTGLVGGSVPIFDEIIVSTSNLKKIHDFNKYNAVLTCDAGCVLEDLNNYVNKEGYELPLDLGAKGSCQIGGNISTHAGGIHFIKYGPLKGNVLGLEVVLPDGRIMNMESEVRKDNTGLDMKQLFIGSEGLLGIVTKANIQCVKKDEHTRTMLIKVDTYEKVLQINDMTRRIVGKNLSAIEFFDDYSYWTIVKYIPGIVPPFEVAEDFSNLYVLVELSGSHPFESLEEAYFEALSDAGLADNCVLCENESQAKNMWKIREEIATASNHMGPFLIYDFSVDIKKWMELSHIIREKTKHLAFTVAYGHIGDGNIHVNIVYKEESQKQELLNILEPSTFKWLAERNGSISAEHGVGFFKANYLPVARDGNIIDMIKKVKGVFDPNGILNPYKVLPNGANTYN